MQLVAVPMAHVEEAWVQALPLIRRLVGSAPDLSLEDVWRDLRGGSAELWLAGDESGHRAAAITRMKRWGEGVAAYVIGVASTDEREWRAVIPAWHEALKARGADRIIAEGRMGWVKAWPGAEVIRHVFEVDLT